MGYPFTPAGSYPGISVQVPPPLPQPTVIYGGGEQGLAVFDGVATFPFATLLNGVYTLKRDIFIDDQSMVLSGVTLFAAGYRIFVQGLLTNNGTIHCNGNGSVLNQAGASSALGSLGIGTAGGLGRSNQAGQNGVTQSNGLQSGAAAGGAAGGPSGGAGGLYNQYVTGNGGSRFLVPMMLGFLPGPSSGGNQGLQAIIGGGAGGGGGGSDNGAATGGGGGGGGGVLILHVYNLVNNGLISANGGNGGNASGVAGNAGGGGGGGGGMIMNISFQRSGTGQFLVNGGLGGAGLGTGTSGSPGGGGVLNQHFAM